MSDDSRSSPPYPQDEDDAVELSAADIEPLEESEEEAEATQVMRRDRIQPHAPLEPPTDEHSLRTTAQNEAVSEKTTNFDVPAELMEQVTGDGVPTTMKMNSIGTRPMPRVESDATVERAAPTTDVDSEGFYTIVARPDADGRIELPPKVLQVAQGGQRSEIIIKVKIHRSADD